MVKRLGAQHAFRMPKPSAADLDFWCNSAEAAVRSHFQNIHSKSRSASLASRCRHTRFYLASCMGVCTGPHLHRHTHKYKSCAAQYFHIMWSSLKSSFKNTLLFSGLCHQIISVEVHPGWRNAKRETYHSGFCCTSQFVLSRKTQTISHIVVAVIIIYIYKL